MSEFDAVLAHLRADPELVAYDGEQDEVPDDVQGYVMLFSNSGARAGERLGGKQIQRTTTYWTHSVGITREQARYIAGRVEQRLLGFRPSIDGRTSWPMTKEASQPIRIDRDVQPNRFIGVDEYDLQTTPA